MLTTFIMFSGSQLNRRLLFYPIFVAVGKFFCLELDHRRSALSLTTYEGPSEVHAVFTSQYNYFIKVVIC